MSDIEYLHIDYLFALNLAKSEDCPLFAFFQKLFYASRNGDLFINDEDVDPSITKFTEIENPLIVKENDNYYLSCNFHYEENIAKQLAKRASLPKFSHHIPVDSLLNKKQRQAFQYINFSPFFIITGGPGSGKSYLAKSIIKAYKKRHPDKKILCTAPTGKAIAHLCSKDQSSKTLHKLLELKEGYQSSQSHPYIIADLVIVDECSMISPKIFSLLLSSLLDHTQVIFIGDPNQLPPVSGGSIFSDITKLSGIDHLNLQCAMRSENQTLIDFSDAIIEESKEKMEKILAKEKEVCLYPIEEFSKTLLKDHIILTPFRKGPHGSLHLNDTIKIRKGDPYPILITKNDPITNLTNGDIGFMQDDVATFSQKNLSLPKLMLPSYEKAFALSIHKSQGSEFDHVSIILPEQSSVFTKELLFTAITRAKKTVSIYGSLDTLYALSINKRETCSKIKEKFSSNQFQEHGAS